MLVYIEPLSSVWCPLNGHTYLSKPTAESCRVFLSICDLFSGQQGLKG